MNPENIAIIIPARYASTRLPAKPLIEIEGKPIIQWVYERASKSKLANTVIIATDNQEIFETCKKFGANVQMTSPDHQSGSDRIAEIVKKNKNIEIIVNVQGDEPLIDPESIDLAIKALTEDNETDISTLIRELDEEDEIDNPNIVKAIFDNKNFAMYFSRARIPYDRNTEHSKYYAHIGLYAYKRDSLLKMTGLEQSCYEKTESLEQLRALQNGMKIKVVKVNYKPIGIDTQEDVDLFKDYIKNSMQY